MDNNQPKQQGELTDAMRELIRLDIERQTNIKRFFEDYNNALQKVVEETGTGEMFQDTSHPYQPVYRITIPRGTYVEYKPFALEFTYREEGTKETLPRKDAEAAGFQLPPKPKKEK